MANAQSYTEQRTLLGHPVGLYVLFFTEMWERFSYYGMRALLVLYMVDFFKWTQEDASKIYKWYTSLVYLTPILGGYLADRYLGNKWSIIIGAILMSVGHFLMAFEDIFIFYSALGFLIMGNGMFKPNMSVQVGRLYPQNDPRRDGAYTIFYMGINLGAFLSPIVCGALRDTPGLGYHWGFGAAGVGMVLGLIVYLFGLPFIKELPANVEYQPPEGEGGAAAAAEDHAMTEEEAGSVPSVFPTFSELSPKIFVLIGVFVLLGSPVLGWLGLVNWDNVIALEIAAGCSFIAAWILSQLSTAVRDRVVAIYCLAVFVVFFWGAFEQAGNAMNVWADQTTDRYLTQEAPIPDLYPSIPVEITEQGFGKVFKEAVKKPVQMSPVLTTSFQSINALAIVVFAPIFAWMWTFFARKKINVSIAMKMAIGVFLQGVAFALMIWSVRYENQTSTITLAQLPGSVVIEEESLHFYDAPDLDDADAFEAHQQGELLDSGKMIAHGGRMAFDGGTLTMRGVFNANHRDRILRSTTPPAYVGSIRELALKTREAKNSGEETFEVTVTLDDLPVGFEPRYLQGFKSDDLTFDPTTRTFTARTLLADKEYKQILIAGSEPTFRAALNDLYIASAKFRVSSWWLFWFYVLCTLGELCLSPVGLSMVSKLAPRRFATMLMGIWLLTSFFGNFAAGLAGEKWEILEPGTYFLYVTITMSIASVICFAVARKITAMMHGVK